MGPKRRKAEQQHHDLGLRPHQNKHPMEALVTDHGTASSLRLRGIVYCLQRIDYRHIEISVVERNSIENGVLFDREQLIHHFLCLVQLFPCVKSLL